MTASRLTPAERLVLIWLTVASVLALGVSVARLVVGCADWLASALMRTGGIL